MHFTCFTGTKVQILTPEELRSAVIAASNGAQGLHVNMHALVVAISPQVLTLLALLAQKYKY
jgi:hypothetical protein